MRRLAPWLAIALVAACDPTTLDRDKPHVAPSPPPDAGVDAGPEPAPRLGAQLSAAGDRVTFRVRSGAASRIEVWLYARPLGEPERLRATLAREGDTDVWKAVVLTTELASAGVTQPFYYGLRAWGDNWVYDDTWAPGSASGFVSDVNQAGSRFNPNKLLLDPYAREISHDPTAEGLPDSGLYATGPSHRERDSALFAPKGIVLPDDPPDAGQRPTWPLSDDVISEVHVRGLTMQDTSVTAACRGTYAGAAEKAPALAALGVTAIELLPVHETDNDKNDFALGTEGDNYWGYSTLGFFAPDRRYACDKSPGGPTAEFRAMVRAFHGQGIKVLLDVVYNHTIEGGTWDASGDTTALLSLRGLDNAAAYELSEDGTGYADFTGIGHSTNATSPLFVDLVLDSLHYFRDELGVDGFRFDLASVLGNTCDRSCFQFDGARKEGILARAAAELAGAALIAEPWGIGQGTYQLGNFPQGFSEWNGAYRDLIRQDQNRLGVEDVTLGWLAARLAGSYELFGDDGRPPSASINFIASHDGMALRDVYACNEKNNTQMWPFGPSDGGDDHNLSWDQGGDPALQRKAARTGLALVMLSSGVPMLSGGDELSRTQYCNNNPYNLDSAKNWLDPSLEAPLFHDFVRRLLHFRAAHAALRSETYWGDSVSFAFADGSAAEGAAMDDPSRQFLALRLDGEKLGDSARSIYIAYNGDAAGVQMQLPPPATGLTWYRALDTGTWMEPEGNASEAGAEYAMMGTVYDLEARAVAVWIER